jgi:cytidine deaminase
VAAPDQAALLAAARDAAERAYVPYSEFPVGAAVLTADGTVFTAGNIENASYPLTMCAERTAVGTAIAAGHREIVAVAVSAPKSAMTTPCGGCRQVLNEFRPLSGDMTVILDDGGAGVPIMLSDLLPRAFGPRNLEEANQ